MTDERWSSRLGFLLATVGAAVVAGLVIFPIVFGLGLEPTLGTELAFTTLPTAFATMPSGRVVAVGFFGLLSFAALSSAVSLLEVGVAAATNTTRLGRRRATLLLIAGVFALGVPSALSYSPVRLAVAGRPVLDLIDESVGTFALPISALLVPFVFVWRADLDGVGEALGPLRPLVRYLVAVVLVLVTAARASGIARPAWRLLVGPARDGPVASSSPSRCSSSSRRSAGGSATGSRHPGAPVVDGGEPFARRLRRPRPGHFEVAVDGLLSLLERSVLVDAPQAERGPRLGVELLDERVRVGLRLEADPFADLRAVLGDGRGRRRRFLGHLDHVGHDGVSTRRDKNPEDRSRARTRPVGWRRRARRRGPGTPGTDGRRAYPGPKPG
jgi:hypothetical protein